MDVRFRTADLRSLEVDAGFTMGLPREVVRAYRKRLRLIRAAADERDIRAIRGNRFEKLRGDRSHQHSIRLNDQWRLILEFEHIDLEHPDFGHLREGKIVIIVSVEDYH